MSNHTNKKSWISDERVKKSGCVTREVLVIKIVTTVRTQRRWGVSEIEVSSIPFDRYAKLFKEDDFVLRSDYWKVRKENGFMNKPLDDDTKNQLAKAIANCHAEQVLIKTRNCKQAPEKLHELTGTPTPVFFTCFSRGKEGHYLCYRVFVIF